MGVGVKDQWAFYFREARGNAVIARSAATKQSPARGAPLFHLYHDQPPLHPLYTGVTNDLARRVLQHREKALPGFTSRHNVDKPVFFEETSDVVAAIARAATGRPGTALRRRRPVE
jgi:hypothetical protein